MQRKKVVVNDFMQKDYVYFITEPMGENFHLDFTPELTPTEMLELGVFGGKYMTDCRQEFPGDWFKQAKFYHEFHNPERSVLARARDDLVDFGSQRQRLGPAAAAARAASGILIATTYRLCHR